MREKLSKKSIELANLARKSALQMAHSAKAAHIGSSLSLIDILAVIYSEIASIQDDSDTVIISKGHAAAGTYAILAHSGFFPLEKLNDYGLNGSSLGGHLSKFGNPGVTLSTGSLGHGLPYGLGIAHSQKIMKSVGRTFVVISDGECDAGTTWESALIATQFKLNNLVVIIDRNGLQSLKSTELTLALEPLEDKWKSFNWDTAVINGHSHSELKENLVIREKPLCIIANTVKGYGVDFMENDNLWHYKSPNELELKSALVQVQGIINEK